MHAESRMLDGTMDSRRFTYNKDVLWMLNHLSQHGKILKLKLCLCGRRSVRMNTRDSEFLNSLKGVKTDKLEFGDPRHDSSTKYSVRFSQFTFALSIKTLFHSEKPCTVDANSKVSNSTFTKAKWTEQLRICSKV